MRHGINFVSFPQAQRVGNLFFSEGFRTSRNDKMRLTYVANAVRLTLLYICFRPLAVIPAKAGIQVSLVFEENGFPITTSGMTNKKYYSVSNVKGFLTHYTKYKSGRASVTFWALNSDHSCFPGSTT
jgi:hypothetical protein